MNILKKIDKLNFEKFLIFIVFSFPVFLVSGPFLSDLVIVICSIYFFLNFKKFKFNGLIIYLFIFYLVLLVTTFFSYNIFYSLEKIIPYIRFILFVIIFTYLFKKYKEYQKYFFYSVIGVFFLLILTSGYIYLFDTLIIEKTPKRLGLLHRDEKILGSITIRLMPILFIALYFFSQTYNSLKYKILYIFLIFGSYFLVVASGERSAMLLLILFTILFILFSNYFFIKKLLIKTISILIIFLLILQFIMGIKTLGRYDIFYNSIKQKSLSHLIHAHSEHFHTAYKMFYAKPLVGHGNQSFLEKCNEKDYYSGKNSCSTHPHNIYLQLLAEHGIFSFILILGIFVYAFFQLIMTKFKKIKFLDQEPLKLSLIAVIINFWPLISTGNFFNNYLSCFFFLSLAFVSYFRFSESKN